MRNEKLTVTDSMTLHTVATLRGWLKRISPCSVRRKATPGIRQGTETVSGLHDVDPASADVANVQAPGNLHGILPRTQASAIGDLAAALAHEVDQPLTAILSNAQAAQRFLAQTPPALSDLGELLAEVVADSMRAHTIIRNMRQSARREPAATRLVDAGSLVREVVRLLRREIEACDVTVGEQVEEDLPLVPCDAVQLQQVLVNLLRNALEAVRGCRAENRRVCVTVAMTEDRGKVCIAVSDQGPGVDSDRIATLFKPFVTTKPQGLGLGLPISRDIVMAHGGQLWAECNAGRGLIFHIELPAQPRS